MNQGPSPEQSPSPKRDSSHDASLDATTRSWVFQALQDITGAGLGSNPAAWRNWWSQHTRH
jgi:hypothetical protein